MSYPLALIQRNGLLNCISCDMTNKQHLTYTYSKFALRVVMATAVPIGMAVAGIADAQVIEATAGRAPGASQERQISLNEAISLARRNNPSTVQARGAERAGKAAIRSAYGAFLPSISLSAGASKQSGGRSVIDTLTGTAAGRNWNYSNGFSVNALLFDGARFSGLSAAKSDLEVAKATTIAQDYSISLQVAQQYYAALMARESQLAAAAQLKQAEEQLNAATRRYQAEAATRSDSLRAFVQVANARSAALSAETSLRSANAALSRLIGSVEIVTASESDTATTSLPLLDSAQLVTLALEGPAVDQSRAAYEAARARRSSAKAAYLPNISAGYSRSGSGSDSRFGYGSNPYSYGGQVSFSISYPLFNQFSREEQIVRAKVNESVSEAQLRDTELAARQQSVQLYDALRTALEQVKAQDAAVEAAEEDLRVQQARYELGLSTIVDLLTSQTQLNQARSDLISARFNARIARVQIEVLIGRNLDQLPLSSSQE